MAKILTFSRKIHHLITTLFIDPTYLHQRMKGSQKVEELKLWPKNDPYSIWWTLTCGWIKRSNTLSLCEKRQSNYKEAACFTLQPLSPCPLSRIMDLIFENNPSQWSYPKNWKKEMITASTGCTGAHDKTRLSPLRGPIRCLKTEAGTVANERIRSSSK